MFETLSLYSGGYMHDRQLDSRISATNGHTFENLCIGDLVLEMFAWLKQSGTMEMCRFSTKLIDTG